LKERAFCEESFLNELSASFYLALCNFVFFIDDQQFAARTRPARMHVMAFFFLGPIHFALAALLDGCALGEPQIGSANGLLVCCLVFHVAHNDLPDILLCRQRIQVVAFVAGPTIEDLVTFSSRIKLRRAWWTFTFAMSRHAVHDRTELHRWRARKAQREDLEALLQRQIVEMLPTAVGHAGARIHLWIGP